MEDSARDSSCSELVDFEAVKSSIASDFEQCYLGKQVHDVQRVQNDLYTENRRLDFR